MTTGSRSLPRAICVGTVTGVGPGASRRAVSSDALRISQILPGTGGGRSELMRAQGASPFLWFGPVPEAVAKIAIKPQIVQVLERTAEYRPLFDRVGHAPGAQQARQLLGRNQTPVAADALQRATVDGLVQFVGRLRDLNDQAQRRRFFLRKRRIAIIAKGAMEFDDTRPLRINELLFRANDCVLRLRERIARAFKNCVVVGGEYVCPRERK